MTPLRATFDNPMLAVVSAALPGDSRKVRNMFGSNLVRAARALLALALLAAGAPAASAASRNLLHNPGFEEPLPGHAWMPTAWDTSATGLPTAFFGRDTFLVHGGRYAVSIANLSTLIPLEYNWSQSIPVGHDAWGKQAVLTVWTRSNGVRGRAFVLMQAYRDTISKMASVWKVDRDAAARRLGIHHIDDPLLSFGWERHNFDDKDTPWVRREVRVFIPPSVNMLFVRLGLAGTGQVIFDDASLTLEAAPPPAELPADTNLLADPGFEGPGDPWEYSTLPYQGHVIARDTTVAHSGRASIRFEGGTEGVLQVRSGVCQAIDNHTLAGKRLRISAWVKTDSLQGVAYVKLYAHTIHGMVSNAVPKQFSANTDWTHTSLEMDCPPDTYEVWAWFAYNGPVPGRVYYDDCSLEIVGPARGGGSGEP